MFKVLGLFFGLGLMIPVCATNVTVTYKCQSAQGISFQQKPCQKGQQTILAYTHVADPDSGHQAHENVVNALNELTRDNPTASGERSITVIGKSKNAADGVSDGYREIDRSPKAISY